MVGIGSDLKVAARMRCRNPTAVTILTLAVGIGANSTAFSIVQGVLLQPLPYFNPDPRMVIERFFSGRDVGKRVYLGYFSNTPLEIIGVVDNVRHGIAEAVDRTVQVYLPYSPVPQTPAMTRAVRSRMEPSRLLASIRGRLAEIVPAILL